MIPREHLPLTLVSVALLGMIFLLFREVNALKTAVAQASVPKPNRQLPSPAAKQEKPALPETDDDDDDEDDNASIASQIKDISAPPQKPSSVTTQRKLNSSLEKGSATASR